MNFNLQRFGAGTLSYDDYLKLKETLPKADIITGLLTDGQNITVLKGDGDSYKLELHNSDFSEATHDKAGLMSAEDKKKLDAVDSDAFKVEIDSVMSDESQNPVQNKTAKKYVDDEIAGLIGGAPAAYNTLKAIADVLNNNSDTAAALTSQLGKKVDKIEGKTLSDENYTKSEKEQLAKISYSYVSRPIKTLITLNISGWKSLDTAVGKYKYYYDVPVTDLTSTDWANVDFAPESFDSAILLCQSCEIYEGKFRLFAESIPMSNITASYFVMKGTDYNA